MSEQTGATEPAGTTERPGTTEPPVPRRRGYRRATGGTDTGPEPVRPAPDDSDRGWNEPSSDDDERLLREVPPHW